MNAVLVLNQNYEAISVCSVHRAFILLYLNKAELVDVVEGAYIRSPNKDYEKPSIIRLAKYVKVPYQKVSLTRTNIFRRDGNVCAYCGSSRNLTIDHIIPKSRGGKDCWENLVTACSFCNSKKGNLTLEESGLTLNKKPYRPSHIVFLRETSGNSIYECWKPYLFMA